jgi:hypothetical protein
MTTSDKGSLSVVWDGGLTALVGAVRSIFASLQKWGRLVWGQ